MLSLAMALMVTVRAWRYRARRAVKTFLCLMVALDWWLLCAVLENTTTGLVNHVFWMNMSYFGITVLPVLWLLFAMRYTDKGRWWLRRGWPLLLVMPAVTVVMVWTNGLHHLMWNDIQLDVSVYPPLKMITFNTWFWIHALYSYGLLVIGVLYLLNLHSRTSGLYRRQVRIMLVAAFIPWVANFIFIAGIGPTFAVDPTPIAFVVTSIAFFWGLSRAKLLNIMPVAYETIFRSINDGVIVIDEQNRIKEFNPAAARMLPVKESAIFGKKLCQVIPARAYLAETIVGSNRTETVISLGSGRRPNFYRISVSSISEGQSVSGQLVLFHDDTERRKAENESREKTLLKTELNERKKMEQLQRDENYVLTLLSQGAELTEILDAIVRLVEAHNPDIVGSILLYDASRERLFPAAGPSLPANYVAFFKGGVPIGPEMGACGTAAFRKERVIVPDIRQSPLFKSSRAAVRKATRNKLISCWSEPIISSSGEILGTIANYQDRVGEPNADNLKVLEWSARIAAIAIERRKSEEALADEAVRRRILIEQSSDGIVVLDQTGRVYEANQRFADMLGYSLEEARQLCVWDWEFLYPREQVAEMISTVDENGDHFETQHRRKDGSIYDVEISTNGAVFAGQKLIFCVCRDITERKHAEAALKKSEEFGTSLLKNAPNPMLVINPDTSIQYVNPAFEKLTGFTAAKAIGQKAPYHWWPEEAREDTIAIQKRAITGTGKNGSSIESVFQKKNGERFWVAVKAVRVMNEGKLRHLLINWVDITESKKAEAALRESEEKFSKAFHGSPESISITTLKEGRFVEVNDGFLRDKGYSRKEIIGRTSAELGIFTNPGERDTIMGLLKKKGRFRNLQVDYRTKSGAIRTGLLSAEVINLNDVPCVILMNNDITERRQIEDALRYQRELIDQIIATIPNAVLVINKDTEVLLANDTFYRTFGLTKEDIENRPITEAVRVKDFQDALTGLIKTKQKSLSFEFRYQLQDVTRIFAAGIVKMENQRYLVFMNDITEEREKQERLYLTDRLASVGEMASGVAHELNNPLTSIIGLSGLLTKQEMHPEQREDLLAIHTEAQRCAAIVKNLLTFARKHAPKREPLQITRILDDVLQLRAYEQRGQNITVETDLAPDLPDVLADYFQMQQVFLNIILNAETAMVDANGRGTLKITGQRVNGHVDIAFEDDGPGISKENLGLIFNPFFTTKEVGKGTGLGLSISYGIVASHGGKIYAKGPSDKGATFVIELPVLES